MGATEYKVTYRRKDDCVPVEEVIKVNDTMVIIGLNYSDSIGAVFLFDVRVLNTTEDIRPKADQLEMKGM